MVGRPAGAIVLALSLLAAPLEAGGQAAKPVPRVGVLRNLPASHAFHQAFLRGLQELGYTEGKNITIEYRRGELSRS